MPDAVCDVGPHTRALKRLMAAALTALEEAHPLLEVSLTPWLEGVEGLLAHPEDPFKLIISEVGFQTSRVEGIPILPSRP